MSAVAKRREKWSKETLFHGTLLRIEVKFFVRFVRSNGLIIYYVITCSLIGSTPSPLCSDFVCSNLCTKPTNFAYPLPP